MMIINLADHAREIRENPRTEDNARWTKAELELNALKLVIDGETEAVKRWHAMHYTGPEDAMEYASKVMTAFGRVVQARRESKP